MMWSWQFGREQSMVIAVRGGGHDLLGASARGTYINYLSRSDDTAVRAAYQSTMQRLVALKRRFDPENVFHRNRNIQP